MSGAAALDPPPPPKGECMKGKLARCENCIYFERTEEKDAHGARRTDGWCMLHPPRLFGEFGELSLLPHVPAFGHCGQGKFYDNNNPPQSFEQARKIPAL